MTETIPFDNEPLYIETRDHDSVAPNASYENTENEDGGYSFPVLGVIGDQDIEGVGNVTIQYNDDGISVWLQGEKYTYTYNDLVFAALASDGKFGDDFDIEPTDRNGGDDE